jgi:hypothetical protein
MIAGLEVPRSEGRHAGRASQDILLGIEIRIVESGRRVNFASALRLWMAVRKNAKMYVEP